MDDVYYADVLGDDGFVILPSGKTLTPHTLFIRKNWKKYVHSASPSFPTFGLAYPLLRLCGRREKFLTFQPLRSGEADLYDEKFQLVSYPLEGNGEGKIILDQAENEPLSCSPDGKFCLYGFYMENLLNVQTKEIIPLLEQE